MSELDLVDKMALSDAIDHMNNVIKDAKTLRVTAERLESDARCALQKLVSIKRRVREADTARENTDAMHHELSKIQYCRVPHDDWDGPHVREKRCPPELPVDSQVPGG